ncbi:LOW QUALITY PROTEIN: von Willebrand factor A domain-containing protein 5B2 [Tachyglossus aculeatus]|uniref:LOW QUALITY PROTEIN: von Willebrand factor A domain-containing protein 5B2 n=1 Tax=Tachyglossus aculeatus TaxID=9261 RepID=UPI0018F7AEB9|nr:LOW QUALITY PROTEIN: von Willebrand factor A domain-containing protein 5B2 [Tachyglossus aculeatus]
MPGLYRPSNWTPLPLLDSWVRARANGPCLGLKARLTYRNPEPKPVEGVFVYPLAEAEVVSGFEAEVAGGSRVSFEVRSRRPEEPCCQGLSPGLGLPRRCPQGHLVLDPGQARSTLVLPLGFIAADGTVTVTLRSSRELPTRPDGALCVALPSVLTPLAPPGSPEPTRAPGLCDDSPTSCFGTGSPQAEGPGPEGPAGPRDVFSGPARCPGPYAFSFEMLVTGPCLLAGVESPSHALRADAPPRASSAATICITLAEAHPCDRGLEILLHPSEPHRPHLLLEAGGLSAAEYEARLRDRGDFQRLLRADGHGDRQLWFLQRRFHKDILFNPVMVLSFCPDLGSAPPDPCAATREVLFLLDRTGAAYKDALLLAVKSLPSQTLINVASFGSSVQAVFPRSLPCSDDTVRRAWDGIEALQAGPGDPDVSAALRWGLGRPGQRGHPRQLFLLTAAAPPAAATRRALDLVRQRGGEARCFCFGLGPACPRLLRGLAALTRGRAYFLDPGKRLQPMLVPALRTALEPALSDVAVDWFVPDAVEALLTPRQIPALYPGDRLLGYCVLFRVDGFRPRPARAREPAWSSPARSWDGSVFPSPEEEPSATSPGSGPTGVTSTASTGPSGRGGGGGAGDSETGERGFRGAGVEEPEEGRPVQSSPCVPPGTDVPSDPATDPGLDPPPDLAVWRRIFQSSYIREQYVLTRCSASPEPSSSGGSESSGSQGAPSPEDRAPAAPPSQQGRRSLAPGDTRSCPLTLTPTAPPAPAAPASAPALGAEVARRPEREAGRPPQPGSSFSPTRGEPEPAPHGRRRRRNRSGAGTAEGLGSEPGLPSSSLDDSETLLSSDPLEWDTLVEPPFPLAAEEEEEEAPAAPGPRCHVVIRALQSGRPVFWEAGAGLEELLGPGRPSAGGDPWDQALHRLTAASVVRDNEQLALRGAAGRSGAHHGPSRKFRLRALQTSKASAAASLFTCLVPVDAGTHEALPAGLRVRIVEPPDEPVADSPIPEASLDATDRPKGSALSPFPPQTGSSPPPPGPLPPLLPPPPPPPLPPLPPRIGLGQRLRGCPDEPERAGGRGDPDYLPLVRQQESGGSFRLDGPFCAALRISPERLRRASPFAPRHRHHDATARGHDHHDGKGHGPAPTDYAPYGPGPAPSAADHAHDGKDHAPYGPGPAPRTADHAPYGPRQAHAGSGPAPSFTGYVPYGPPHAPNPADPAPYGPGHAYDGRNHARDGSGSAPSPTGHAPYGPGLASGAADHAPKGPGHAPRTADDALYRPGHAHIGSGHAPRAADHAPYGLGHDGLGSAPSFTDYAPYGPGHASITADHAHDRKGHAPNTADHAPYGPGHAPSASDHTHDGQGHAPNTTDHSPYGPGHASSDADHAPCRPHHAHDVSGPAPSFADHAPYGPGHTSSPTDHAPYRPGHAPSATDHAPSWPGHTPAVQEHAPCWPGPAPAASNSPAAPGGAVSGPAPEEGTPQEGPPEDLRGRSWATAVALSWLEHRCAAALGEWELAAAKADGWLRAQRLPDGLGPAALKAAARSLFLLLRRRDPNLRPPPLGSSPADGGPIPGDLEPRESSPLRPPETHRPPSPSSASSNHTTGGFY